MANHSLASNVVSKAILNLFNIALPLIVTRYVYHALGPVNMGSFQFAQSIYNYFMVLGLFGISNYAIREIAAHRNNREKVRWLFKNMMVMGLISNLVAVAAYAGFIEFMIHDPVLKTLSWIMCINLLGQCFYLEWYNEAMEEFRFITLKTVIIRIGSVVLIMMFVNSPEAIYIYAAIYVLIGLVNYLVSYIYIQQRLHMGLHELFTGLALKQFIWPLATIMVLNNSAYLFTIMDTMILGEYVGRAEVSFFSIGNRLCETIWTLLLSVVFATLPRLSLYLHEERHLYQEGVLKVMRMLMFVSLPCGVALWMLGPELVDFFGGPEYIPAIMVTRIFAARIVLLAIQGIMYNQIIFLHGHESMQMVLNLGCGGLNIVLNFLFLPILTPTISLLCTIGCEMLYIVFNYFFITYKLKISLGLFRGYNLYYLAISLTFVPIIYWLQQLHLNLLSMFVITIPLCIAVYLVAMAIVRDEAYLQLQSYVLRLLHIKK